MKAERCPVEYAMMSGEGNDKTPSKEESEMESTVKYCCQLSKSVMADVVITGPEISTKDIEMLRKYLELTKDALKDDE